MGRHINGSHTRVIILFFFQFTFSNVCSFSSLYFFSPPPLYSLFLPFLFSSGLPINSQTTDKLVITVRGMDCDLCTSKVRNIISKQLAIEVFPLFFFLFLPSRKQFSNVNIAYIRPEE